MPANIWPKLSQSYRVAVPEQTLHSQFISIYLKPTLFRDFHFYILKSLWCSLKIKMNVPSLSSDVSLCYLWFIHDSFINLLWLRDKLLDIVIANVNMASWSGLTTHVWPGGDLETRPRKSLWPHLSPRTRDRDGAQSASQSQTGAMSATNIRVNFSLYHHFLRTFHYHF